MSNSAKRIKIEISVTVDGVEVNKDFSEFVKREELEKAAEKHIEDEKQKLREAKNKREQEILAQVREFFPEFNEVEWSESGGLEDDSVSHYYYCSRSEIRANFETDYALEVGLMIGNAEDDKEDKQINFDFSAYQDIDIGDDKIYLETHPEVSFWTVGFDVKPEQEKLEQMFRAVIEKQVEEPMCSLVLEHLSVAIDKDYH